MQGASAQGASRAPEFGVVWRLLVAVVLGAAMVVTLFSGGWLMTSRRDIFADLARAEAVSAEAARASDRMHDQLMSTAPTVVAAAVVLWLLTHLVRRRPLGLAGFTAVALISVGSGVVIFGTYVTSLTPGAVGLAGAASVGVFIMGGGFLLVSVGALAALVAMVRAPRSRVPKTGFAGWR